MTLHFQIGGTEHEYVRVELFGSNSEGWLPSRITVSAGSFSGAFLADLDIWAFARFEMELKELYASLSGTATFRTHEQQLDLTLRGDGRDHVHVTGAAMDAAGHGNVLRFRLAIDQTEIAALLRDLAAIAAAYPLERTPGR